MTPFLETPRLIIYSPSWGELDNMCALQADADVMQFIGQGVRSREEVTLGLEKALKHQEKYGYSLGSVYEKNTGNFVGRAGLIHLSYDESQPDIEVGYALIKDAWNKGYATELAGALIHWGFKHLPVKRLVAVINPKNERSRHVLEKLKMKYVGLAFYWNQEMALYEIPIS